MVLELVLWNVERTVKRLRWMFGFIILLVSQCIVFSSTTNGVYYIFGMVTPLAFMELIVCFIAMREVYVRSAIHIFLRVRSRGLFWFARVLSTCIFSYGLVFLSLLGYMVVIYVINGSIFPSTQDPVINVLNIHKIQSILLICNLLSLGYASILVLSDVFQLLFDSAIISYLILIILLILSGLSHILPIEPVSHIIFLFSPFLRMSLFTNLYYHVSPIYSMLFLFLFLCVCISIGYYLFLRKELTQ